MAFQGIFTLLLIIGCLWAIWKYLLSPMIPDEKQEADHVTILRDKLEKLQEMKSEYQNAKVEVEVTEQIKKLDKEIDVLVKDIKNIEND